MLALAILAGKNTANSSQEHGGIQSEAHYGKVFRRKWFGIMIVGELKIDKAVEETAVMSIQKC